MPVTTIAQLEAHLTKGGGFFLRSGYEGFVDVNLQNMPKLEDEYITQLAELLANFKGKVALKLGNSNLTEKGALALVNAMRTHPSDLVELDLVSTGWAD